MKTCHFPIEDWLIPHLVTDEHPITIDPKQLLTWNRLDLGIKLAYLSSQERASKDNTEAYTQHIYAFSRGVFIEPGNEQKNSIERYITDFTVIANSINKCGFEEDRSLVPVASDGSLLNGAHRTAACIHHQKTLSVLPVALPPFVYDWRFFLGRGLAERHVVLGALEIIQRCPTVFVALLWPRAKNHHLQMAKRFSKVIYQRNVSLSERGARNLLAICYRGEHWLGRAEEKFPGVDAKLNQVYSPSGVVKVIAFQASDVAEVIQFKEQLREIASIGKHSVHVSDNVEEARELAELLLNDNGVHFLETANPIYWTNLDEKLNSVKEHMKSCGVARDSFLIDSGAVLEAYGLREAADIDVLVTHTSSSQVGSLKLLDQHDDQLAFHRIAKEDLLFDRQYYFVFLGVKFIAFNQLKNFKKARAEPKDFGDLSLMAKVNRPLHRISLISELRSNYRYTAARIRNAVQVHGYARSAAKLLGIHKILKRLKHGLMALFK